MTLNRWMTAGAAVVGRAHEQQGAGCQDCVGYSDTSKFSAVALADGAGSAKYASEGAGIAVNVLLRIIERSFSSFSQQPSDSIGKLIISSMADGIESAAQTAGVAPREFASTLLFAATGGGFLIAGQLGDGLIAVQKNGRMVPLCEPAKGEFKNETVFVTSPNAAKHIFVTLGPCDAVAGIVLMSDGSADSLFHNESRTFAQAVNNMAGWLDRHTPADVSKALRENLWNVIRNRPGITDDCSIAVLRRVSIEVEDLAQRAREFQSCYLNRKRADGLKNAFSVLRAMSVPRLARGYVKQICTATGLSPSAVRRHLHDLKEICQLTFMDSTPVLASATQDKRADVDSSPQPAFER